MSFVINGLENANEFYSQHYLDEVAEKRDLKPLFDRCKEQGASSTVARLRSAAGASYFRAVGAGQNYGLSARGLASNTGEPSGEEFPEFREFWIERPEGV